LEILSDNWPEFKQAIADIRDLHVLTYYFSSERRATEQRWRKLNENIQKGSLRFGEYLGEFEGIRRLLALLEMRITSEDEFCRLVMGYDPELCNIIMPVLQLNKGQTFRQIQIRLAKNNSRVELKDLENVLDDLANIGKIRKQYENDRFVFRK
jgi:hypothetical protein